jgi:murein DD-endopeptidase MepM/ murein hydrolase activator NlpD
VYELQFHPADIRKKVRYAFVSPKQARWIAGLVVLAASVVVVGLALLPMGVQALMMASELHLARHQNELQQKILAERVGRLAALQERVDQARALQSQIGYILGVSFDSSSGGGFPEAAGTDVTLPESQSALRTAAHLRTGSHVLLALASELEAFAQEHAGLLETVPSISPLPVGSFVLTSPFGERTSPFTGARDFHAGIDLAARVGTPVRAVGAGKVLYAGRFPLRRSVRWWRYGNVVVVQHGDRYVSVYAHLNEVHAKRWQRVERGEEIGTVGNTGWSTAPHLHFEVRVIRDGDGEPEPVDPRIFILNYRWKEHEALLVAARDAPAPDFDPLPSAARVR